MKPPRIVLVHSPLVGPLSWAPVARVLQELGRETLLAVLDDDSDSAVPRWTQHALSVMRQLARMADEGPIVLAGHSGAGAILPAIGAFSPQPVAGYVFVDAGLPTPGRSRLDEITVAIPDLAAALQAGESFPQWTDDDLRDEVPDEALRAGLIAELRPRPLRFFSELLPVVDGWPDAPCGYVQLSAGYAPAAEAAREQGWPVLRVDAGHFHLLREPRQVAHVLLQILLSMS